MGSYKPEDGAWIVKRNAQAQSFYGESRTQMEEVEQLWQADFDIPKHLENLGIEVVTPSEPHSLLTKMNQMVGVRPGVKGRRIEVVRLANSDTEMRRGDKLERFLKAHWEELGTTLGRDLWADASFMALLRGKAGLLTYYRPGAKDPCVRTELLDPMEYSAVYNHDGVDWMTRDRWMFRYQLVDYLKSMSDAERGSMQIPVEIGMGLEEDDPSLNDWIRVIEYRDDEWAAWTVEGFDLLARHQHECSSCMLREVRFASTPLSDPRWATQPFLGPAMGDLKAMAVLQSKLASAVQAFYFPKILIENPNGGLMEWDWNAPPGTVQEKAIGSNIEIVKPEPNNQVIQQLQDVLKNNISHATLPDTVFFREMPNVSGFLAAQVLGSIKDSIAAFLDEYERCMGLVCGDVLEVYQKYDDGNGWEYPLDYSDSARRRRYVEKVTESEIEGHCRVRVSIKVALPQDMTQIITNANQLRQVNPATGQPYMAEETIRTITGLADLIEDEARDQEALEQEILIATDPEVNELHKRNMKARHAMWIEDMEGEAEKFERRRANREAREAERDILAGISQDVVIPAELTTQQLEQVLMLEKQGTLRATAVEMVKGGMPLGVPGQEQMQPPPGGGPDIDALTSEFLGGAPEPVAPEATMGPGGQPAPGPFTGFDNGISPTVAPAAMQGGQPRPALDQTALQIEGAQTQARRNGLPPAR